MQQHAQKIEKVKFSIAAYKTPRNPYDRKIPPTYEPFLSLNDPLEPCPHIFRPSCYTMPGHLNNIIDFGAIVQPFAPCCHSVPLFPSYRCTKCLSPYNHLMKCQSNGRIECNICHTLNDATFDQQKTLEKIQNYAVYDSKISSQISPNKFILVIQVTHCMTQKIQALLQILPKIEVSIAILLFSHDIRVILPYDQPQMVILTDLEDIVMPDIFLNTNDSKILKISQLIQQFIQNNVTTSNIMRNQCLKYVQKWYKECHLILVTQNKYRCDPQPLYGIPISSFIFYQSPDQKLTVGCHNGGSLHLYHFQEDIEFYYDLFELLTTETYSNVEVKVHTNNIKCTSVSYDFKKNCKNTIKMLTCSERHNLTINFEAVNQLQSDFLMEIKYCRNNTNYVRCISYRFQKNQNNLDNIGDEALFFLMHRNILQNQKNFKSYSTIRLKKLLRKLKEHNPSDFDFSIPASLKHCYFYAGMLDQLCLVDNSFLENSIFWYKNRHQFCSLDLETLSKKIYLKLYRIDDKPLKNLKMQAHKIQMDGVYLVDNGRVLYLVVGQDITVSKYQEITGLQNQTDILDDCVDIPDNGSLLNQKLRDTVSKLRQCNRIHHLRIQTIIEGSSKYEKTIATNFFCQDAYRRFLYRII